MTFVTDVTEYPKLIETQCPICGETTTALATSERHTGDELLVEELETENCCSVSKPWTTTNCSIIGSDDPDTVGQFEGESGWGLDL